METALVREDQARAFQGTTVEVRVSELAGRGEAGAMCRLQLAVQLAGRVAVEREQIAVESREITGDRFVTADPFDQVDARGVALVTGARAFNAVQSLDFVEAIVVGRGEVRAGALGLSRDHRAV